MNYVAIKGRLTRDPETRTLDSGNTICSFCVAVDRRFKNQKGERLTDFFNASAWNKTGEFVQKFFQKGQEILVNGSMQSRKVSDDGVNRIYWDLHVDSVEFCGSKTDRQESVNQPPTENEGFVQVDDADLPF